MAPTDGGGGEGTRERHVEGARKSARRTAAPGLPPLRFAPVFPPETWAETHASGQMFIAPADSATKPPCSSLIE